MTVSLSGARVLLTGASGGLGHAIARRLHAEGATLVLTGRRADVLAALAKELGAVRVVADLGDPEAVGRVVREAGEVDILVANAALPATGTFSDLAPAQLERILAVNLHAPISMTHALLPRMLQRRSGHVVLIGSVSGLVSSPASSMYNATKFGLRGFGGGLRQDLHGTGVGVSVVMPGFVSDAGMFADSGMELPRAAPAGQPRAGRRRRRPGRRPRPGGGGRRPGRAAGGGPARPARARPQRRPAAPGRCGRHRRRSPR